MSALSYAPVAPITRHPQKSPARRSLQPLKPAAFGDIDINIERRDGAGATALIRAAETGDTRQIRRLIEDGANINAADGNGWNALMKAAKNHHLKAVAELITSGINLQAETRNGWNALSIAVKAGSPQIIALIASSGGKTTTT